MTVIFVTYYIKYTWKKTGTKKGALTVVYTKTNDHVVNVRGGNRENSMNAKHS